MSNFCKEAKALGDHRTKWETVRAALEEYVNRCKQLENIALFGQIEYDDLYDYKLERKRKPSSEIGLDPHT